MTKTHSPAETPHSVLVVDDDDVFRSRLVRAFAERGFEARGAGGYDAALVAAREESPEHAVVDLRMNDKSGLEVLRALKALDPTTVVVVLTGYGSIATALEAMRLGATHYLTKPADVDDILAGFARAHTPPGEPISELPREVPSLARAEWEHINRVLADCHGNISQAARLLGLHRRSLQRKLAKHPVNR
jgi:two-component system response regulator RegA